jgi:predicted KAP-like P-loop ATPase
VNSDRPIESAGEDRLGRADFAATLAEELRAIGPGPGRVVALVGPWGGGKTSVLRMIRERLESEKPSPIVTEVNPWLFSGTEQLVELFITDLANQLSSRTDRRADAASKRLREYAKLLNELSWVPGATRVSLMMRFIAWLTGKRAKLYAGSVEARRAAISEALRGADERVLVVVDDIDRLTDAEIRDVVRTVRLVGDFENVTYLLAFDRTRVEKALGDKADPASGRDYLEKIVQAIHPLPAIRYDDLSALLSENFVTAIGDIKVGPFDVYDWQNIGSLAVRPLFKSLRDVYRFTNVLPATIRSVGDEVALQDVLALEAVRVLEPDVWDALISARSALGYTRDLSFGGRAPAENEAYKALVADVMTAAGDNAGAIRELLRRVFPASETFLGNMNYGTESLRHWRRERRVAHPTVFAIYLERTLGPDAVPAAAIDVLFDSLATGEDTEKVLGLMSADQVEEALGRLEAWEHDFGPPNGTAIAAFMRQTERLRHGGKRGMFDFGSDIALDRVVLRLLQGTEDPAARLAAINEAIKAGMSLTARMRLVRLAGHEENQGEGLVPETDAKRLAQRLAKDIAAAGASTLIRERDVPRLVAFAVKFGGTATKLRVGSMLRDDAVLAKLLGGSLGETTSQGMGDVGVRRTATLPWDWLKTLLPEGELETRVRGLAGRLDPTLLDDRTKEALELAEKYAEGWRPDDRDW